MKVTVACEIGDRVVMQQGATGDTRGDWRNMMTEMTIRVELAAFGPPLDQDLSLSDGLYQFKKTDG